jgi:hypothetical protein
MPNIWASAPEVRLLQNAPLSNRLECPARDLRQYPSAAKIRNLIWVQKRRNDIQEMAYRLTLIDTS